jgi:hypothetical protein
MLGAIGDRISDLEERLGAGDVLGGVGGDDLAEDLDAEDEGELGPEDEAELEPEDEEELEPEDEAEEAAGRA